MISPCMNKTEYAHLLGSFSGQGEIGEAVNDGGRVRSHLVQHRVQMYLVEKPVFMYV